MQQRHVRALQRGFSEFEASMPTLQHSSRSSKGAAARPLLAQPPRNARQACHDPPCCEHSRWRVACAAERMQPAEVARTITSLVTHGTLSTVDERGTPLGTYVTFVLDDAGCPLIRLRADAAHTQNLQKNGRCTIFAHPSEQPARQLARVTLIGEVEDISEDEALVASTRHSEIYAGAIGVDAPQRDDIFKRLRVDDCFYVAGLGVRSSRPRRCRLARRRVAPAPLDVTAVAQGRQAEPRDSRATGRLASVDHVPQTAKCQRC